MKTVKIYIVKSMFSSLEIQARNKKEAARIFLQQIPTAKGEKLSIS